jgi:broad specificity phosphatase PhoE
MSTRVFLVRHGATLLAEDHFAGAIEVPLSEVGRQQSHRLAERLAKHSFAAVYASPLGRAMETAHILAAPHGLPVSPVAGLGEIAHGRWEGLTRVEVTTKYPEELARWEEDPYTSAPQGGETGLAVTARALPALLDLVRTHPDASVVAVSHKATVRLLVSALLGLDPRHYRDRLEQNLAALTIVEFREPAHARLLLYNDTSHYAELA